MITKEQLIEEYKTACRSVIAANKLFAELPNHAKETALLGTIAVRDTLSNLLEKYYDVSRKELQSILDDVNGANYHI